MQLLNLKVFSWSILFRIAMEYIYVSMLHIKYPLIYQIEFSIDKYLMSWVFFCF